MKTRSLRALLSRPPAEPSRATRRRASLIFGLGLAVNVLVCLPFVVDPFDWLGADPKAPAAAQAPDDLVVLLSREHDAQQRAQFFADHPSLRIVHTGTRLGTLLVRVTGSQPEALAQIRAQPFAALVLRGKTALCE